MAMRVEWVGYGREAGDALRAAIAAGKGGDPLVPITVVVSSNHIGVATRRLLASGALGPVCAKGTGLAAVTFLTPYRLAELLGAPILAGTGRRPVSTPVIACALRAALVQDPGVFAQVADHPATETALVQTYRELRDLSPAALDALAGASRRAADVVRLHRAARARLEPDWYDEEDLMSAAASVIARASALGEIIIYLPQRISLHAADLLGRVDVTVLAGTTGDPRADADVLACARRVGHCDAPMITPQPVTSPTHTAILTASDADDEVRQAVRAVVDAVRVGTPLDRIAVLYASSAPYARLAYEQFGAAGIAINGASVVPLSDRVAGRTLLDLLALPAGGFGRAEVFAWLAGTPVLDEGRWAPITAWERLSRDAGVVSGRTDWSDLLNRVIAESEETVAAAANDPDEPAWRRERAQELADRARRLRAFVLSRIDDLASLAGLRPWSEHAGWTARQLEALIGESDRRSEQHWPRAEAKAAERVEAALARLSTLDSVEGPVSTEVFTRTLRLELEADLARVGRFGEGVLVGTLGMGVGLDLDLVIVLGLAEGMFPTAVRDDSLLPDHERRAAGGELALREARIEREHRELLAALAGATRQVLCVPRGDLRRASTRVPSRWVLQVASQLEGRRWSSKELLGNDRPWLSHIESFDAGLRRMGSPATEQEHRLRSLLALFDTNRPFPDSCSDEVLAGAVNVLGARRSARFTRFDGNLAGLAVPSPLTRSTSATRLEQWAICPFAYLLREILAVGPLENPEDHLVISPMNRGSLVHEVLEAFVAEVLNRPLGEQPEPEQAWSDADRERMLAIAGGVCDSYEAHGLTGRAIFWRRDRRQIFSDLEQFLVVDSAHRRTHGTRPLAAELAFGLKDSPFQAVGLALPDGGSLLFRGQADRVDIGDDGALHVVDYKTGRSDAFKDLCEQAPDLRGHKLQLPVYGAAARKYYGSPETPVYAEYWFVSAKGRFRRIGYPVTETVLALVGQTLATMVGGIEDGVFPNHPSAANTRPRWVECSFCDPDNLGVSELRGHWERKRMDPSMSVFAELAEPRAALDAEGEAATDA